MAEGYPIKLVRDRVASIDTSQGLAYRPVADLGEHMRRLRAKLVEEVGEYLIDPSRGELVDVHQVVRDLAFVDLRLGETPGLAVASLEPATAQKFEERGGFIEGVVLETVEP
jgi:predicted house-cleaning noncanonical NTP pyrophosphatase (MazG superfamily)